MVLGLTMAEITILLVFLLLLAATAASMRRAEQYDSVARQAADANATRASAEAEARAQRDRADQAERQRDNARLAAGGAAALARRLDELTEANRLLLVQRDVLRSERDALRSERDTLLSEHDSLQVERNRLSAELEVRARAGNMGLASLVRRLDELLEANRNLAAEREVLQAERDMLAAAINERVEASRTALREAEALRVQNEYLHREAAVLRGQNEQMRREREVAQRRGQGGSGLPHCWPTVSGDAEFMLRISMHDGGRVMVRDRLPKAQPSDPAWRLLVGVPRDRIMPLQEFRAAAEPLLAHARAQRCRHAVEAIDMTGPTNKEGFKSLQRGIWEMGFFQREFPR
jgi:hypothetical protein